MNNLQRFSEWPHLNQTLARAKWWVLFAQWLSTTAVRDNDQCLTLLLAMYITLYRQTVTLSSIVNSNAIKVNFSLFPQKLMPLSLYPQYKKPLGQIRLWLVFFPYNAKMVSIVFCRLTRNCNQCMESISLVKHIFYSHCKLIINYPPFIYTVK